MTAFISTWRKFNGMLMRRALLEIEARLQTSIDFPFHARPLTLIHPDSCAINSGKDSLPEHHRRRQADIVGKFNSMFEASLIEN